MPGVHPVLLMFVAVETTEYLKGGRIGVTVGAPVPLAIVRSRKDRKEGVVAGHQGRAPGVHRVTFPAVGGKTARDMVRRLNFKVMLPVAFHAECRVE